MSVSKNICSDEISSEFTLIWKIKNLSYCTISKGQNVKSSSFIFRAGDSILYQCQLFFYPLGKNTNSVECSLYISQYTGKLDCYFCVYSTKDLLLHSEQKELYFSPEYPEMNMGNFGREIFEKLSNDAIVLHCHIGKLPSDKKDLVHCFTETRLSLRRNIFYWKVENFKSLQLEEKSHPSHDWIMYYSSLKMTSNLFLLGADLKEAAVHIWLTFDGLLGETFCSCALYLVDENEKVVKYIGKEGLLGQVLNIMKFSFRREEISGLLCSDSLIVRAEVNLSGDNGSVDQVVYGMETIEAIAAAKGSGFPELPTDDSLPSLPNSSQDLPSALSVDMLSLFQGEGPPPDFELRVEGRCFPVHQTVLGARSPVFRSLLASDTSRKSLELTDVDVDTAERMVLYAYTDQEPSPDLDWESVADLYAVADKYELVGLKKLCGVRLDIARLGQELNLDNAPQVLWIADRFKNPLLKKQVVEYVLTHVPMAFETENWKKLELKDPWLANEVLHQIMKEKLFESVSQD